MLLLLTQTHANIAQVLNFNAFAWSENGRKSSFHWFFSSLWNHQKINEESLRVCWYFQAHAQLHEWRNCVVESESFRTGEWNFGKWGYQKYKACGLESDLELPKEKIMLVIRKHTHIPTLLWWWGNSAGNSFSFSQSTKYLSVPPVTYYHNASLHSSFYTTMMTIKKELPSQSCVCESTSWKERGKNWCMRTIIKVCKELLDLSFLY